jgi:hypothetical protein
LQRNKILPLIIAFFTVAVVLAVILYIPLGVADGGGLYKTLEGLGLNYIGEPSANYFDVQFGVFGKAEINNTSSAISAAAIGEGREVFDVRSVAIIYIVIFIIGIMLAIKSGLRDDFVNWLLAALCVLVFADIGYTAYFNTFYDEGAILTTYIMSCAFILLCYKKKSAPVYFILPAALFAILFAFCTAIQAWIAIIFGLLIIRLIILCRNKMQKVFCVVAGVAVVCTAVTFALNYKSADYEKDIYNAVFFGTAKYESVSALGLNENLDKLNGVFYSEEISRQYHLEKEFFDKIGYAKIAGFYLKRPGAFVAQLNSAVKNAYSVRPLYLGNYTKDSGKSSEQSNFFSIYSTLKAKFIPNTIVFTAILFIIYFAVLIYIHAVEKAYRFISEFAMGIGVAAIASIVMSFVFTGIFEIGKQLFTYNILFDTIIVFSVVAGARYMLRRRKELQERYGSDQ